MKRLGFAFAIAILSASSAISGDRGQTSSAPAEGLIFFSGGIPALEIKSNPSNTACPYEAKKATKAKRSKAVFAIY